MRAERMIGGCQLRGVNPGKFRGEGGRHLVETRVDTRVEETDFGSISDKEKIQHPE